ncbi:MAG: 2-keto-4-pentenoate hydratase [Flavobacteriales bacterium]
MNTPILDLAKHLDAAAMNADAVPQISLEQELSLSDAYKVQVASMDQRLERGEKLLGYKMGFTSKAKMEQMGVHELIWGRLTSNMELKDGGTLELSKYVHPRAEPEVAFRISKDIEGALQREDIPQYVDAVCVAIEIIDSRYKNFKFSLEDVVADNCSSTGYLLGEWLSAETKIDGLSISLEVNGEVVQSGSTNDILGNPWNSFLEATRIFKREGIELKKGMVLLAGAATPAVFLKPGDKVKASCDGLGEVSLEAL